VAGFEDEDDDEDENEAPHEGGRTVLRREIAELKHRTNHLPPRQGGPLYRLTRGSAGRMRFESDGVVNAGKRAEPWFTLGHGSARLEAQHTKGCGASFALRTPLGHSGASPHQYSAARVTICYLLLAIGYWLLAIGYFREALPSSSTSGSRR
jgi:hypothetical protein